jgi:hypothetical protein
MKQTGNLDKTRVQWDRSRSVYIYKNGIPARLLIRE